MRNSSRNSSNSDQPGSSGEVKFKAFMKITRKDDGSPVCFKLDGERFRVFETIKLQSGVQYKVLLEFKPNMDLSTLKVAGLDCSFQLKNNPAEDGKSLYEFTWSTYGLDTTCNRHRADVPITFKFKSYKSLDFKLQCKFYPMEDTKHATWGKPLHTIGITCVVRRGSDLSSVEDMVFS